VTSTQDPTLTDFEEAASVTCDHLRDFFFFFYSTNLETFIVDFECSILETSGGDPLSITFASCPFFADNSDRIPTQEDIDTLLQVALQPPESIALRENLQQLPPLNPFSSTDEIVYQSSNPLSQSRERRSASSRNKSRLLAAVFLGAFAYLLFFVGTALKPYLQWPLSRGTQSVDISTVVLGTDSEGGHGIGNGGFDDLLSLPEEDSGSSLEENWSVDTDSACDSSSPEIQFKPKSYLSRASTGSLFQKPFLWDDSNEAKEFEQLDGTQYSFGSE